MKRAHPEDDMQRALFQWITLATPRIPQLAWAFAVPNGGKRDAREAARMKGAGVKAGVPDILIPFPMGVFNPESQPPRPCGHAETGLAIELKAGKNKPTAEQLEWHKRLRMGGWRVAVCYSFDEARQVIADYFGVKP